jgi:hypothetical protein
MSPDQRALARHALGLPNARRCSYRNHYVIDGGPDHERWTALVDAGDARRRPGSQMSGGMDCFWLTRQGAVKALNKGERLDLEDFPPPPASPAP